MSNWKIGKYISVQKKYAFISTFIFGILAHGMMIFNKFSNHDDLIYMFEGGVTFTSGRWMLFVVEKLRKIFFQDSLYSVPTFNGIFVFFCIAVSVCILIDLFEIKSIVSCIFLGGVMVCIPAITGTLGHMYTAQYYALAILMAVLGSFFVLKKNEWYFILCGIALMTCSVGIYQSYIPTMLCICLFGAFKLIMEADTSQKRTYAYKKIIIVFFSCVAFFVLYLAVTFVSLRLTGLQLSSYKGLDEIDQLPLNVYLNRAVFAYREFFMMNKWASYNVFPGTAHTLFKGMVILFTCFLIYWSIRVFRQNKLNGLFLFVFSLLSPLCVNFILVMTDVSSIHALMAYSYTIFIVFFVYMSEKFVESNRSRLTELYRTVLNVGLGLMVIILFRYDNACYTRMAFTQQQTLRYYSSLITRMQNTPGYRLDMRVAYIGQNRWSPWDPTTSQNSGFDFVTTPPFWGIRGNLGGYDKEFMEIWFDFSPREADASLFADLPEVKAMPSYPEDGSIKVIDDTLVVKFR